MNNHQQISQTSIGLSGEMRDPWWFKGLFLLFKLLWLVFLPLGRLVLAISCFVKPISQDEDRARAERAS
jgi:hypothetical protein